MNKLLLGVAALIVSTGVTGVGAYVATQKTASKVVSSPEVIRPKVDTLRAFLRMDNINIVATDAVLEENAHSLCSKLEDYTWNYSGFRVKASQEVYGTSMSRPEFTQPIAEAMDTAALIGTYEVELYCPQFYAQAVHN